MNFLSSFRGRLLLILAVMLVATLGVQYYLNLLTQTENERIREEQEKLTFAAVALGMKSVPSEERLQDLISQDDNLFPAEPARKRVKDIIVIDDQWQVWDSLNPNYLPTTDEENSLVYRKLADIKDLPPLVEGERLGADIVHFPNRDPNNSESRDAEAHVVPIQTSFGQWYVMVLFENDRSEAMWRAAQPLVYTLGLLLASSTVTFLFVWWFARPIANLAAAARAVAAGDLSVRVPDADRNDEVGRLASRFNEMTAELEKKHDLEAKLQQAEKSAVVGRLGSAIAHEIRNPLNYINLTLDHLRSKFAPADEEKKATFDKLTYQLKGEVARINRQISDFLNYSRPARADLRPVEARDLIEDSLRIVEAEAAEKSITIGVVEHENVPKVLGDPEFLRSVFNNLFINAVQAMEPDGGHLGIKLTPDDTGKFVNFEVSDTGKGIKSESLDKIFEPYFSTKETGTGLGLAIVQKIVETHNGSIEVESNEGGGTKFTVKLPAANRT
jgi:signal transduction histidine kinase